MTSAKMEAKAELKRGGVQVSAPNDSPFGDVILAYSRAQAIIEDGVLVDVTDWAKEAGFRAPVAMSHAAWVDVAVISEKQRAAGQSERGRVHDALWMAYNAVKAAPGGRDVVYFNVQVTKSGGKPWRQLKIQIGGGDQGEAVLTIMKLDED